MKHANPTKEGIYTTIRHLSTILFSANVTLVIASFECRLPGFFYGITAISSTLAISNFFQMWNVLSHKKRHNEVGDEKNHYNYYGRIRNFAAITLIVSFAAFLLAMFLLYKKS